jgi:hypothetical protein
MTCCPRFANRRNSARRQLGGRCCHFANPLGRAGTRIISRASRFGDSGPVWRIPGPEGCEFVERQFRTGRFWSPFSGCNCFVLNDIA